MKVYITKYALTDGIQEYDNAEVSTISRTMISIIRPGKLRLCFHKPHWHETREAAIQRAEEMRLKKIASLNKQIEKLEQLKFE